jgi:hypothetical protein
MGIQNAPGQGMIHGKNPGAERFCKNQIFVSLERSAFCCFLVRKIPDFLLRTAYGCT